MDIIHAIILAIVQGITEFLPISSSAHLILVPELLGWPDQGLAFDVAVHIGTLLAVLVFLKKELQQIIPAWFSGWRGLSWNTHGMLAWMLVLGTVPVGLVGLLAGDFIESHLRAVWVIGLSTLIFGLVLGWADRKGDTNIETIEKLSWQQVLIVGGAQALALIPGTSRSGITMTAMLALGFSRVASAKFSFLLAVPVIALSGLLKTQELLSSASTVDWIPLIIGVLISALTAFLCMEWFMRFIQKVGMLPFVIYRIILAAVIFAVLV